MFRRFSPMRRLAIGLFALALLATSCAGSSGDEATVASGDAAEAVVEPTTPPVATTAPVTADEPTEPEVAEAPDAQAHAAETDAMAGDAPLADEAEAPTQAADDTATVEEPTAAPVPTPTDVPQVTVELPAVEVVDLLTGVSAGLDSYARPGATLVWFWAPH